jgi:hypothetical protein
MSPGEIMGKTGARKQKRRPKVDGKQSERLKEAFVDLETWDSSKVLDGLQSRKAPPKRRQER